MNGFMRVTSSAPFLTSMMSNVTNLYKSTSDTNNLRSAYEFD